MTQRFWTSTPLFPLPIENESTQPRVKRLLTLPTKALLANPAKMRELSRSLRYREIDGVEVTYYGQPIARLNRPQPREFYAVQLLFSSHAYRISTAARAIARAGHERGLIYGPGWAIELIPILRSDRIRQVIE